MNRAHVPRKCSWGYSFTYRVCCSVYFRDDLLMIPHESPWQLDGAHAMYPWPEKSENAISSVTYRLCWNGEVLHQSWEGCDAEAMSFVEASTQHRQSEAYGIHWLTTPNSSFAHFRGMRRTMEFMNLTPKFWHFELRFARGPMKSFC